MSYVKLIYHIVLRTYRSVPSIVEDHEKELYAYMMGFVKNKNAKLIRIGGMPDHIHLLVSLPSTITLASFVQELKISANKWMKNSGNFPLFQGWSKEYAAFSYADKDRDMIANYIKNQKEHHKKRTFADEYRTFLKENGIAFKEEYFLKD